MTSVRVELPQGAYDVHIGPGALRDLGTRCREVAPSPHAALLADARVFDEHGIAARQSLVQAGYHVVAQPVALSEDHKHLETVRPLYDLLIDAHLERSSPVIALGGGVTGDTIGFLAATYLRGVPFIQCPTTLLAMVDASVGGKVGVNLPRGKNLVGAFHQPRAVVIDTHTLSTLPMRELRCGLAECVKHALIAGDDAPHRLAWLEANLDALLKLDAQALVELVRWNVAIKAKIVAADERESGVRAFLNLGHTFAHAIEATSGYGVYQHGEAVALGLIAATRLSATVGSLDPALPPRTAALLDRIGLPTRAADLAPLPELIAAMQRDKKVKGGKIRLVLLDKLGDPVLRDDVALHAVERAWVELQ